MKPRNLTVGNEALQQLTCPKLFSLGNEFCIKHQGQKSESKANERFESDPAQKEADSCKIQRQKSSPLGSGLLQQDTSTGERKEATMKQAPNIRPIFRGFQPGMSAFQSLFHLCNAQTQSSLLE